ncbi:MAG: radical SAM protein [Lachnospiraceae bacterium]|nr:radical SAM protein [Lachnospiraceae bacterium]
MNVLFISPAFPDRIKEYLILPSLEACVMSSILKEHGHQVDMLDMKIHGYNVEQAIAALPKSLPQLICIEDELSTHCTTLKLVERLKEVWEDVKIAVRGEVATFVPQELLRRNPLVDFAVRFDDDYALLKIIEAMEQKRTFASIGNIAYRSPEGGIVVNDREQRTYQLDSLPMPDRKLYDIDLYLKRDSETIVRSSRGCPGNCLFCSKTKMAQFGVFSPVRFCDELEELKSFGFQSFFFSDDTFAFSDQRLKAFYDEVVKRKLDIRWTSNLRIKDINDEKIRRMKEIGAYRVFVGIETINASVSNTIRKNLAADEIKRKTDILHKYGMEFHASFILGNPGDTEEDLQKTIEFVKDINPTLVTFNLIRLIPGLEMYNQREQYGYILEDPYWYEKDEWSRRVIAGTKELPPAVLEKWSRRMLMEFIK